MSAWRLFVKQIEVNGPARGSRYDDRAIQEARRLKLIERAGTFWRLTPLGLEFCEGRVVQNEVRPGGRYFVATWLRSLPRDIRLHADLT